MDRILEEKEEGGKGRKRKTIRKWLFQEVHRWPKSKRKNTAYSIIKGLTDSWPTQYNVPSNYAQEMVKGADTKGLFEINRWKSTPEIKIGVQLTLEF